MAIDYKLMKSTGGVPKNTDLKVTVERETIDLRRMSGSIEQATLVILTASLFYTFQCEL